MISIDGWKPPREYHRLKRKADVAGLVLRHATEPWHLEKNGGHRFSIVLPGGRDVLLATSSLAVVRRWLREYAEHT